jgi:pilus assembly protein CpaF
MIIHVQRLSDGARKVMSVQEVIGLETDTITLQEIFRFERAGMDADGRVLGTHRATGIRPRLIQRAEEMGLQIPPDFLTLG